MALNIIKMQNSCNKTILYKKKKQFLGGTPFSFITLVLEVKKSSNLILKYNND